MSDVSLQTLASDPNLIPGIYNGCDQWCHYCAATDRCLVFKCVPNSAAADMQDIEQRLHESMRLLHACYKAEGLPPPADLVGMLNGERPRDTRSATETDALARMGRHYAVAATVYLAAQSEPLPPSPLPKREHGPTPFEVFLYYHVLIAIKIHRAISSALEAGRTGSVHARWDADISAKVALIGIDRSDDALQVMTVDDDDERIPYMRKCLSRLKREVLTRFPAARTLVRPGLDNHAGE